MPTPSITPLEQETLINPYSNKIFDFDTSSSNVYISGSVNNLLRAIGEDCVIDGLTVNVSLVDSLFTVRVNPGKAICDCTLVEITSPSSSNILTLDLSPFDETGYLILTLSYKFLNSPHSNLAKFRLFYVSSNNMDTVPEFQPDYDRIVLAKFLFYKITNTFTQTESLLHKLSSVIIKNKRFIIYPRTKLLINSFEEIKNLFTVLNYD